MKEKELRKHAVCDLCSKKIGESNMPIFYVITLKTYGIDLATTQRAQGLGLMIGAQLAQVMGPDEELAKEMSSTTTTVCFSCNEQLYKFMREE